MLSLLHHAFARLIDDEMQISGDEGWWKAGGSSGPSGETKFLVGRRDMVQDRAADRRALAAVVEAEAGLPTELDVMWVTHITLGLDRATELLRERLIRVIRVISVSATGAHAIALTIKRAQLQLVGL